MDLGEGERVYEGSPPRVRSRHVHVRVGFGWRGITSACAEQTSTPVTPTTRPRDHLRVCGADGSLLFLSIGGEGSPPRVRSRLGLFRFGNLESGITSACAEQTCIRWPTSAVRWDHLRVCGADVAPTGSGAISGGSPPRVRSRRAGLACLELRVGITSACAEQTLAAICSIMADRDHLRVCGADSVPCRKPWNHAGSPPRVRSRLVLDDNAIHRHGITSACAEQTDTRTRIFRRRRDHLRVCGADPRISLPDLTLWGSPPRVRSRPAEVRHHAARRGITSACAEQTRC